MDAWPVSAAGRGRLTAGPAALDAADVALLQACVGFHAKAQSDPGLRDRLYRLWCKLDELKRPSDPPS